MYIYILQCCGAGGAEIILRPGAEIIFLINVYCSQFGVCKDEEKLIPISISMVQLMIEQFQVAIYGCTCSWCRNYGLKLSQSRK